MFNKTFRITKVVLSSALAVALAACIHTPPRSEPTAFKSVQQGQIQIASVATFTDCVTDVFADAHYLMTNLQSRQMRRTDGFRVETYNRVGIMMSADINDDGRVELFEANAAAVINTTGEREAFKTCLERFGAGK